MQEKIRNHIMTVGGYWSPLSGFARVSEEVGEIFECLRNNDIGELKNELADLFIITTCIADQYAAKVETRVNSNNQTKNIDDLIFIAAQITEEVGEFGRTLNSYDGAKKLKPNKKPRNIETCVRRIHSQIFRMASILELDLEAFINDMINKSAKRDKGRFGINRDPITEESRFEYIKAIKDNSSKIWGAQDENDFLNLERFIKIAPFEGIDMFVYQIPNKQKQQDLIEIISSKYEVVVNVNNEFVVVTLS